MTIYLFYSHDNIAELMGVEMAGFERVYKEIVLEMKKKVIDYVKEVRQVAGHKGEDDFGAGINDTPCLKYDNQGYPILVGFDRQKPFSKSQVETLVRTFLASHYCECC